MAQGLCLLGGVRFLDNFLPHVLRRLRLRAQGLDFSTNAHRLLRRFSAINGPDENVRRTMATSLRFSLIRRESRCANCLFNEGEGVPCHGRFKVGLIPRDRRIFVTLCLLFGLGFRFHRFVFNPLRFSARNTFLAFSHQRKALARLRLLFRLLGENFVVLGLCYRFLCVCSF